MSAAQDAAVVLARANLMDARVRNADPALTAAWAETIGRHNLEVSLLIGAVMDYYTEPRERVIQVGDVIRLARDARQRRALAQTTAEITAATPLPPGSATHFEVLDAEGPPIRDAYEVDGALDLTCPRCEARPRETCGDGVRDYRIPCVARLVAARKQSRSTR